MGECSNKGVFSANTVISTLDELIKKIKELRQEIRDSEISYFERLETIRDELYIPIHQDWMNSTGKATWRDARGK